MLAYAELRQFVENVFESVASSDRVAYHVSRIDPPKLLGPTWFSDYVVAVARKRTYGGRIYEYELRGNVLSRRELEAACRELNMDVWTLEAKLTACPTEREVWSAVGRLPETCDGFEHFDYDPRDATRDVVSVLVFEPAKCARLVRRVG